MRTQIAFDVALGVALCAIGELEAALASLPGSNAAVAVAAPFVALPLVVRRRFPFAALVIAFVAVAGAAVAGGRADQSVALTLAIVVVVYSAALHCSTDRRAVAAFVVGQLLMWFAISQGGDHTIGDYAFSVVLGGGPWLAGYAVRSGRVTTQRVAERAERERGEAIAEERARIAREMHDVVAHTMSVVVVQTGAARRILHDQPERSEQLLETVETTSRQALGEMRRLLGLIRTDASGVLEPQPGLAQLEDLVGADVELTQLGEPRPLPPGIDLAAYRIAQEALTNARRHGAGPARLSIRHDDDVVIVECRNALNGTAAGPDGHGLIGMRERVHLYGGTLDAGPDGEDFSVVARLPLA